jgi:predicted regulator of amino acid metabolism with ACT domain
MDKSLWKHVEEVLGSGKRIQIVKTLLKYGLSVREEDVYIGDKVKATVTSLAEEAGVDRRVVMDVLKQISKDDFLREFFLHLRPAGPSLVSVSRLLGYRCLVVEIFEDKPGILAWVANALAEKNINILQVVAEDPNIYEEPKLYVVVSQPVPSEVIEKILQHPAIKRVSIS